MQKIHFIFYCCIFFLIACHTGRKVAGTPAGDVALKFVNVYVVPNDLTMEGGTVGGLSGIDYDVNRDHYYLICDDPSSRGLARFYTAKINLGPKGIDTVIFAGAKNILDKNGQPYADITKDRVHSADLEAMRYDARADVLVRSSEGQRYIRGSHRELQDPDIIIMDREGRYRDSFQLPSNMRNIGNDKGPRHNGVFEGLDFDHEEQALWVSVENTIYDDGPDAGTGDSTAWVRLLKFDMKSRTPLAQYAYRVDAVPYPPVPSGAFRINGISDILYLGNSRFIIIERAYSTGRNETDVKIYLAELAGAEDISEKSLAVDRVERALTKKLLFDINSLDFPVQNIEGVTFGPKLPNGNRSLIFVSDNNFSSREQTHFLLFEYIEK